MHGNIKCDIDITSVLFAESIESAINGDDAVSILSEYDMYFLCGTSRNRNEKNQSRRKIYLCKKNKNNICSAFDYNFYKYIV